MSGDKKRYKRTKKILGVGINDADYVTQKYEIVGEKRKRIWACPFYRTWTGVLQRCYDEKLKRRYPSYKDCSICEEWLTFSNFKAWMEGKDWEGKQLDKDLLVEGNKVYCPEYCIFVDQKINLFVIDNYRCRGKCMIGVHQQGEKYISFCNNPFTGKGEYLGLFINELDAHLAWKKRKHEIACMLAESELVSDSRLIEALKTRYL